jgi:hypothetical protein
MGGTLYVRLWTQTGGNWLYYDYTFTMASLQAVMITPVPGSTFGGTSVTFTWTAGTGVLRYCLQLGTVPGGGNLATVFPAATSYAANVPANGATLYVRLWSLIGAAWQYVDYTYTAANLQPALTTPVPGSTLAGGLVAFTWTAGIGVTQYCLQIGSAVGGGNILTVFSTGTTYTASLPAPTGSTIYVRLWSMIGGVWQFTDYTYVN